MATTHEDRPDSADGVQRDGDELLVHEEEMQASLGEVLEAEHEEEAAELEATREDLPKTADDEILVHEEAMHASLGEVLGSEHEEEAAELEAARAELPPEPGAESPADARARTREARKREATKREATKREARPDATPLERTRARRRSRRRVSPLFLVRASFSAARELRRGVKRARRDAQKDLIEAARRAVDCFRP